jgi:hypothetical protein
MLRPITTFVNRMAVWWLKIARRLQDAIIIITLYIFMIIITLTVTYFYNIIIKGGDALIKYIMNSLI